MSRIASIIKVVAVNLLLIFGVIVAAELVFGSWFSDTHPLYQFTKPRNLAMVQDNPFGDQPQQIHYTRDANGFRGLEGPVGDIDIITVGGSTTDQRYLDDGSTFQAVLKDLFRKEGRELSIANAGIDGQSTIGHLHNFASWFNKIEGLKTKYILYYIGVNDVLRLEGSEVFDVIQVKGARLDWQLYIREKSIFYQIYLIVKQMATPNPYAHGATREYIVDPRTAVEKGNISQYETEDVVRSLAALRGRVKELDRLTNQMGAKAIFVTQRSARWDRRDGTVIGVPVYRRGEGSEFSNLGEVNGVDIYNLEKLVSDSILSECEAVGAICIDLFDEVQFQLPGDFYDPVHTTSSGAKAVGELMFQKLRDRI
jgi:hypothetical protein